MSLELKLNVRKSATIFFTFFFFFFGRLVSLLFTSEKAIRASGVEMEMESNAALAPILPTPTHPPNSPAHIANYNPVIAASCISTAEQSAAPPPLSRKHTHRTHTT